MPRLKMVKAFSLPITRLIEENCDSQASTMIQAKLLQKYNEYEKLEDQLKEYLKERDPYAYNLLCQIDKAQDEITDDLLYYADYIYRINHISNGLLKRFDCHGERREKPVTTRFTLLFR